MAQTIEAVYEQGVFKPLQPVQLTEGQRVALSVEPTTVPDEEIAEAEAVSFDRFTADEGRIIVAGITSNVAAHQNATRYGLPDWAAAGLKKASVVTAWLACITPKLVVHKIGALSAADMVEVDKRLRVALKL